jgi:rhomboid protease GluP
MTDTESPASSPLPKIPDASPSKAGANLTPAVVMIAPPAFPIVTFAILLALLAVFAIEIVCDAGPSTKLLRPALPTLLALGGLTGSLVVQSGEWYRLLSAPFLHVDAGHLIMNAAALLAAGLALERLLGRAWFGTIYVIGALAGSLFSLAINPTSIVSVGASGAVMALFAAMLVVSLHFPSGAIQTNLLKRALYVLIPSLLPLTSTLKGTKIDYGAHFGGAIAGGLIGLFLLEAWWPNESLPRGRKIAVTVATAGALALAYPIVSILKNYDATVSAMNLIPRESYPSSDDVGVAQSSYYVSRYPRDPRSHMFRPMALLVANDNAGAEREAREGLREESRWGSKLPGDVSLNLRTTLALVIVNDRPEEAKTIVRPVCKSAAGGSMRKVLASSKLCDS